MSEKQMCETPETETAEEEAPAEAAASELSPPAVFVVPDGGLSFETAEGRRLLSLQYSEDQCLLTLWSRSGAGVLHMTAAEGFSFVSLSGSTEGAGGVSILGSQGGGSLSITDDCGEVTNSLFGYAPDQPDPLTVTPPIVTPSGQY